MKKKIVVLISCIIIVLFFSLFVYLYNNVFTPFKGENKDILYSPMDYSLKTGERFEKFYHDFLEYENYEKKYDTKFYYCFGHKSLIPQYTLTFDKYGVESYSYVIKCEDDYNQIKEKILNEYQFADIPLLLSYESNDIYYESFIEINGTVYQEIHYNYINEEWEIYFPKLFRKKTFWFGYNDERKEIIFSLLYRDPNGNDILKEELIFLMKNNLYS